jgi:hypothetical protein
VREEPLQELLGEALKGLLDNLQLVLVKTRCDVHGMKDGLCVGLEILLITVAVLIVTQIPKSLSRIPRLRPHRGRGVIPESGIDHLLKEFIIASLFVFSLDQTLLDVSLQPLDVQLPHLLDFNYELIQGCSDLGQVRCEEPEILSCESQK